jgi:hypothetical protein
MPVQRANLVIHLAEFDGHESHLFAQCGVVRRALTGLCLLPWPSPAKRDAMPGPQIQLNERPVCAPILPNPNCLQGDPLMTRHFFLTFVTLLISCSSMAAEPAVPPALPLVKSNANLPACVRTIGYREFYPKWSVRNDCDIPIEIHWCWLTAFRGWAHIENVCEKTGMKPSGVIAPGKLFEFKDRPFLNTNKASAVLVIEKVCDISKAEQCN